MKFNGRIVYAAGAMVGVILVLGCTCVALLQRQKQIQQEGQQQRNLERQGLALLGQSRDIHLGIYKGLSWISAGYDARKSADLLAEQQKALAQFATGLAGLEKQEAANASRAVQCQQALALLKSYADWVTKVVDMSSSDVATATMFMGSAENAYQEFNSRLSALVLEYQRLSADQEARAQRFQALLVKVWIGAFVGAGLSIGGMAAYLLRSIARPIQKQIGRLQESSATIAAACQEVAGSSRQLAQGSSAQAASLEETSASLEEMSSMTRHNLENAEKVKQLAALARQAGDRGSNEMQAMDTAMAGIKQASDAVASIIKTIQEIAFQTNILALNAAVEAARAGEAGMGFAVVADEVRNLAQRSAAAAKETTAMIEDARARSQQGVEISVKVGQSLTEIVNQVRRVDELIAQVASASQEQSQGIQQVSSAVVQVDQVTQANAAGAEQSAHAAAELSLQAKAMQEVVGELLRLVGGQVGGLEQGKADQHATPRNTARLGCPTGLPQAGNGHTQIAGVTKKVFGPAVPLPNREGLRIPTRVGGSRGPQQVS